MKYEQALSDGVFCLEIVGISYGPSSDHDIVEIYSVLFEFLDACLIFCDLVFFGVEYLSVFCQAHALDDDLPLFDFYVLFSFQL